MNELETMIETLNLGEVHKQELRSRWLKQLSQMDLNARRMHKWNSLLHFTMIAGGACIAPLVGLEQGPGRAALRYLAGVVGFVVAISALIEGYYRFGEREQFARWDAELLKAEGLHFLQLNGPYESARNHEEGYPVFVDRIERILQHDSETHLAPTIPTKKP